MSFSIADGIKAAGYLQCVIGQPNLTRVDGMSGELPGGTAVRILDQQRFAFLRNALPQSQSREQVAPPQTRLQHLRQAPISQPSPQSNARWWQIGSRDAELLDVVAIGGVQHIVDALRHNR